ncbi:MAG: SIMPL domain-containing protein [Pseudanabaenaceae cyanobacterium bins.39]|nr:SIMPL domain-containing protein [Pseudanabaenaceae cyanobacterium bins.39]
MRSLNHFVSTICVSIAIGVPAMVAIAPSVKAQELTSQHQVAQNDRVLTVTGRGERSVKATKVRIQLGVSAEAKTAIAVQTEIGRRANRLVSQLQRLNVESLETTSMMLNPKYVYTNNQQEQTGFIGQTNYAFSVGLDRAAAVIDAAIAAGANQIGQISFTAAESEIYGARQLAMQDAVKDAQAQANTVLAALGMQAKSIKTINIGESAIALPTPQADQFAKMANAVPIIGGDQKVSATVTLQITY